MGRAAAHSCSVAAPPPRSPLFVLWGHLRGFSPSGLRQQAEPGSYRGEVERPQVLDVQAKLCRVKGARIAPSMLSPLPMVTAQ